MFSSKVQPTSELYAAAKSGNIEEVKNVSYASLSRSTIFKE